MPPRITGPRFEPIRSLRHAVGKTAVICSAAFIVALGMVLLSLGLNFYLKDVFEATRFQVGAFFALWSATYVTGCLAVRPATDRFAPRHVVLAATALMVALSVGLYACPWLWLAFVLYAVLGVVTAMFWPPLMSWLSGAREGSDLNRSMSRFNMAWSLGAIVGPLLAGWLSQSHPALPLAFAPLLFAGAACLILGAVLCLPSVRDEVRPPLTRADGDACDDRSTPLRHPAWVGLVAAFLCLGVLIHIFPMPARQELDLSKSAVGALFFIRSLCTTLGFVALGRTTFWHFRRGWMPLSQAALAGVMAWFMSLRSFAALAVAMGLTGFFSAYCYSSSQFHGASGSARRTARMAIHEALLSVGIIVGALLGGYIYQARSMTWVYGFCIAALGLSGLTQAALCLTVARPGRMTPP